MTTTTATATDTDNRTRIFIYGTLKHGFPNHHHLEAFIASNDATFLGNHATLRPYPLVRGPLGIPFLLNLPGSGFRVKGEVYAVSGRALAQLDELEGVGKGHYERLTVEVTAAGGGGDGGVREVEGYFGDKCFGAEMWEKCGRVGLKEYSSSDADEFARIDSIRACGVGSNLGDHIRLYLRK